MNQYCLGKIVHVLVNQIRCILELVVDVDVELGVDYCGDNFDVHCAGDLADAVVIVELDVELVGVLVDEVADDGVRAGVLAGVWAGVWAVVRVGVRAGVLAGTLVDVSVDRHDYHFRLNLMDSIEMVHLHDLMVVLCADVYSGYLYCYRDPDGVVCSGYPYCYRDRDGVDYSVDIDCYDCYDVDDAHRIVVAHFHDWLALDAHFDEVVAVLEFALYV